MKSALYPVLILIFLSGCAAFSGSEDDRTTRTFGTLWDDQMVESKGRVRIKKAHPELRKAHISITAYNGVVLLIGQVSSEELKKLAADKVGELQKVRRIYNELTIAGPTSIFSRANDSWLTTKIKTKMAASKKVDANRIKVVTENGIVYLLGMVTREESEAAVELVRKTYGVQKVVKVFEIVKDIPKQEKAATNSNEQPVEDPEEDLI